MQPEEVAEIPQFDSNRKIELRLITPDGDKIVTVSFLSDQQIMRRQRARKVIIKDLGNNKTDTDIQPNETVDSQLLKEISDDGPELDGAEAVSLLDRISEADVMDVIREGPAFRVYLKVPGAHTEHIVSIPTQRQVMEYRRHATRVIGLPFGRREVRMNLEPSAALYDKLCTEQEGYASGSVIPISHKAAAVSAAVTALEREIAGESDSPDF